MQIPHVTVKGGIALETFSTNRTFRQNSTSDVFQFVVLFVRTFEFEAFVANLAKKSEK
jgi:hypothetical protein